MKSQVCTYINPTYVTVVDEGGQTVNEANLKRNAIRIVDKLFFFVTMLTFVETFSSRKWTQT